MLAFQFRATVCCTEAAPVPESATVAGEPVELLVILTLPLTLPVAAGLKCTVIVELCEGARVNGVLAPLSV